MKIIQKPTVLQAAGSPPKKIEEFIGRVNSQSSEVGIARMSRPAGWSEPGQTPAVLTVVVTCRDIVRVLA